MSGLSSLICKFCSRHDIAEILQMLALNAKHLAINHKCWHILVKAFFCLLVCILYFVFSFFFVNFYNFTCTKILFYWFNLTIYFFNSYYWVILTLKILFENFGLLKNTIFFSFYSLLLIFKIVFVNFGLLMTRKKNC